ncbi:hypothetical protein ZWY2020_053282 [Hordeum vulgare]|nr:hypothetical protein ZWY2020_053282 [Hordeum vulgare]
MPKWKIRLQKIEHRWAKEWKEYRFVTPKYAKKFALKPPGKRPPLEDYQDAHPSSLKTIDDYPEEKSKHLSKLQKQGEVAVRKFNEESAAAATATTSSAAETSGTSIPEMKSVPPEPKASKPQEKMPQKAAPASTPKPSAPPKASKPEQKQIVKQLPTVSSSSVPSATSSETKSSPTPLKTKVTAGRGTRPSPSKIIKVPFASEGSDEFDDDTLQDIIRNKQERVAQASGSSIPMAMDPKVLLDYINIWYEDPNTPIDDLKLPPHISHIVATFINEAKWTEQQAKHAKVAKLKKEKFLRHNLLNLTPDALVSTQVELNTLKDKYSKLCDRQSLKSNFIKFATEAVDKYNKKAATPAPTPQPLIEEPADETAHAEEIPQESSANEPDIEEIGKENPVDDSPTTGETAPAGASTSADDSAPADETASAEKTPSPKDSKVKKMTPSASDVKKTRAAEKEAKKRKASSAEESTEAKRLKALEENAPLDPVPLNVAPSYEMTPFESEDKEHVANKEMINVESKEHTYEEIRIDDSPQTFISPEETAQGSVAPTDESGSSTKQAPQAEEKQSENPQPDEIQNLEQNPQPEAQSDPIPPREQNPQPEAQMNQFLL